MVLGKEQKAFKAILEKYGKKGAMISAVDLLKGIGKFTDMQVINVDGATGYIDTNFDGKVNSGIKVLKTEVILYTFMLKHPDECGHRHEIQNKVNLLSLS